MKKLKEGHAVRLALAVATAAAMFGGSEATAQGAQPTIEGVWRVTRHAVDCPTSQQSPSSFPALMTFHKDGTISSDAVGPGSTAAEGTAEHGLWQRTPGRQQYSFRLLSYGWDNTGAFEGSAEITGNLQLTGNTFTYDASIQFFDADGNPAPFTLCGSADGIRFQ